VSRHLAVLTSVGLIKSTRNGQQLVYSLSTSVLVDIIAELADLARVSARPPEATRPKPRIKARVRAG
jgi:DNA-binding transcriptional ArsR family regulator